MFTFKKPLFPVTLALCILLDSGGTFPQLHYHNERLRQKLCDEVESLKRRPTPAIPVGTVAVPAPSDTTTRPAHCDHLETRLSIDSCVTFCDGQLRVADQRCRRLDAPADVLVTKVLHGVIGWDGRLLSSSPPHLVDINRTKRATGRPGVYFIRFWRHLLDFRQNVRPTCLISVMPQGQLQRGPLSAQVLACRTLYLQFTLVDNDGNGSDANSSFVVFW